MNVISATKPSPVSSMILPVAERLSGFLGKIHYGQLQLRLPGGDEMLFEGKAVGPKVTLNINSWRTVFDLLLKGDVGFGEAYIRGDWECSDLAGLLELAVKNRDQIEELFHGNGIVQKWLNVLHRLKPNSRSGSQKNIHAHYDIGNDFYRLWLDESMTYSSGIFTAAGKTLNQAQISKYERILSSIDAKPGMHIVEIGCGWGGFAEHAASHYGCRVTGITVSQAQYEYAVNRIEEKSLSDLVDIRLIDYRDLSGQYDAVVSIEMFEAVGEAYWATYFETVKRLLRPGGKALIQSITIDESLFEGYRRRSDFIQQYIFPGGMLPSPKRFVEDSSQFGMNCKDAFAFGKDYAKTLRLWREVFEGRKRDVIKLGLDERFIRTWRFYLAYCEAGFNAESINVYQFLLQKEC